MFVASCIFNAQVPLGVDLDQRCLKHIRSTMTLSNADPNRPTPVLPGVAAIAYHLASLADSLPGFDNAARARLAHMADLLHGLNPNTEAAHAEALRGTAAALRPGYIEQRPETWLLCAVAHLLSKPTVQAPGPLLAAGRQCGADEKAVPGFVRC
jgi:hypothetical protein